MNANSRALIYLIAGEPSGDLLGARLMASLKKFAPSVAFAGIGGPQMEQQGLRSLFPYQELSLMGFSEIVPHIPRLLQRVKSTHENIQALKPRVIITIDSPGFNFRLIEKVLADPTLQDIKRVHYVAPS